MDTFGNTALHIAANQNQTQAAILLIQKGINTLLKNNQNLTALDLAKTKDMKEIIGYVTSSNRRNYEGYLLKKRKFDIRVWVLINQDSKVFYFKEGYIRTSCEEFSLSEESLSKAYIHLTNNAV